MIRALTLPSLRIGSIYSASRSMGSPEQQDTPVSGTEPSSQERSGESSGQGSRSSSRPAKKSARIHWQSEGEQIDTRKQRSTFNLQDHSGSLPKRDGKKALPRARRCSLQARAGNASPAHQSAPNLTDIVTEALEKASPKPSILRHASKDSNGSKSGNVENVEQGHQWSVGKAVAQRTAQSRAQRLSRNLGIRSAPGSKRTSPISSPPPVPSPEDQYRTPIDFQSIPLERLETRRRRYGIDDDTESDESDKDNTHKKKYSRFHKAARRLVKRHTVEDAGHLFRVPAMSSQTSLRSGQITPEAAEHPKDYVPRPKEYHEGILSSLMRLYNGQVLGAASSSHPLQKTRYNPCSSSKEFLLRSITSPCSSGQVSPEQRKHSGQTTPKHQKWYYKDQSPSTTPSISNLVSSSRMLAQPTAANITKAEESTPPVQGKKAGMRPAPQAQAEASGSNQSARTLFNKITGAGPEEEFKIHLHIADVLKRHQYLLKLCKSLMSYGAPTHRLEGNPPNSQLRGQHLQ